MIRIATGCIVLLVSTVSAPALAQTPAAEVPAIVTRGQATVTRAPELARLRATTTARADRSDEAARKSAEAMIQLRAKLQAARIPDAAIKTTAFVVQPEYFYQNNEQKFRGFLATNSIEVRVDNVALVTPVIAAISSVNLVAIDSLEFDVRNRKTATEEALRLAVSDAMSKARVMALGAGGSVGEILKLQEEGLTFPEPFNLRMIRAVAAEGGVAGARTVMPQAPIEAPIAPGLIGITARAVLMVAIK